MLQEVIVNSPSSCREIDVKKNKILKGKYYLFSDNLIFATKLDRRRKGSMIMDIGLGSVTSTVAIDRDQSPKYKVKYQISLVDMRVENPAHEGKLCNTENHSITVVHYLFLTLVEQFMETNSFCGLSNEETAKTKSRQMSQWVLCSELRRPIRREPS